MWKFAFESWKEIIALTGLVFGLYQYWRGRILQQARFAAELVDKLYSDEDLWAAWNFVDWRDRQMLLPAKYSEDGELVHFTHSVERLADAMSITNRDVVDGRLDLKDEFRKPEFLTYVAIFDRLFSFLESLYGYYMTRAIRLQHIGHLLYLLERLEKMQFRGRPIFDEYLARYSYDRVVFMMEGSKLYFGHSRRLFIRFTAKRRTAARLARRPVLG